eukprot:TRINITY_DN3402_c2_g1_i3.p1 TRINITY_DN3402_c2_g1~~TRINITY_DN3402_c2_g1_i3.p1  ORF type:complete len:275 (+),score=70.46 TRINITY_DN3402_c2_g1_i3:61-825(+)
MYDLDEIMAQYGEQDVAAKLLGEMRFGDALQFDVGSPPVSEQTADTPQTNATEEEEEVKWDLLLHATATSVLDDAEDGEVHITQDHHKASLGDEQQYDDREWEEGYDTALSGPVSEYHYGFREASVVRREKERDRVPGSTTPTAMYYGGKKGGKGVAAGGYSYGKGRFRKPSVGGYQDLPTFPDLPFGVSPSDYTCPPWRVTVLPNGSYTADSPPPTPYQRPYTTKMQYYNASRTSMLYEQVSTPQTVHGGYGW